jgi:hypothetical protein
MTIARCTGATLAVAALLTASVGARAAGSDVSANWAGYVAVGQGSTATTASRAMTYTDVTGRWVLPKATCRATTATAAAIWVGLGGYSVKSRELEQVGTEIDCDARGKASYYVWYELVPADPVTVGGLRIDPGDLIVSSILAEDGGLVLQVTDRTRHTRFTRRVTMASPDLHSAEWIVEAPVQCSTDNFCKQTPLTHFAPLTFTHTFATGNGVGGTVTSANWLVTSLRLVPRSYRAFGGPVEQAARGGGAGAVPSALAADGTGFTIDWLANPATGA